MLSVLNTGLKSTSVWGNKSGSAAGALFFFYLEGSFEWTRTCMLKWENCETGTQGIMYWNIDTEKKSVEIKVVSTYMGEK